jgi:sRNA-binding regulator protein Hfq
MTNERAKRNWGQSQAKYLAALQDRWVKVAFLDGKTLKGVLVGVDTYEIFIRPAKGPEVLISKGAVKYIHPTVRDEASRDEEE